MTIKKYSVLTCLLLTSTIVSANNNTLGAVFHGGDVNTSRNVFFDELNDESTGQYTVFYERYFTDNIALEVSYTDGDTDDFTLLFLVDILTDSRLEYNSLAVGGRFDLSLNNTIVGYLKGGLHRYDYELSDDNSVLIDDNGFSYYGNIGVEFRFSNLSIFIEAEHLDMGDDVSVNLYGVGASFRF